MAAAMDLPTLISLLLVGLCAGGLTTVTGFGGGMLLALALSVRFGPREALALSAPTLALGHVHRTLMYRHEVDRAAALRFACGAVPGALVGSTLALSIPAPVLAWLLLGGAAVGISHALGWLPLPLGRRLLVPGAATIGLLASTSGGGGPLLPPVLISSGLEGRRFVATAAIGALSIHATRIVVYALGGWLDLPSLGAVAILAAGLVGGNLLGRRAAAQIDEDHQRRLSSAAMVVVLGLALAQLAV